MTAESMSMQNASRHTTRMKEEAFASARIAKAPRMDPPMSSRESLEEKTEPISEEDTFDLWFSKEPVSARVETAPPPTPSSTPQSRVQALVDSFDAVTKEDLLFYLSPVERDKMRDLLREEKSGGIPPMDPPVAAAAASLGLVVFLYLLTPLFSLQKGPSLPYRGSPSKVDKIGSTTRRVIDDLVGLVSPSR